MTHLQLLGVIVEHLGQELQRPDSKFSKHFMLSTEQFTAFLKFLRIMTAPSVQTLYIHDLAKRWGRSAKTISNWTNLGLLPSAHKRQHDTRSFWYASEIYQAERMLIAYGYIAPRHGAVSRLIERCRRFLCFSDCSNS